MEKVVTPESPSETKGRSVRPGEKVRQKFSSTGGKAPGCWLLIGDKKCFVLLCPISEQFILSS